MEEDSTLAWTAQTITEAGLVILLDLDSVDDLGAGPIATHDGVWAKEFNESGAYLKRWRFYIHPELAE